MPLWILSFTNKIDYATAVHGLDVFEGRAINRKLQLSIFRRSNYITYASSYTKTFLTNYLKEKNKEIILNNGYNNNFFYYDNNFDEIFNKYNIKQNKYVFCFGRLVERKGFDKTIEAIKDIDDLKLVISGDGNYKDHLINLSKDLKVENKVIFTGKIDQINLRKLYSNACVYSMPSRMVGGWDFEGFGITYLEAAACQCPSIGGKESGAIDAIIDKKTGFLIDPNSIEEIKNKIIILKNNPELRNKLGINAKKRAENNFKWSDIVNNFLENL